MDLQTSSKLREAIVAILAERGHTGPIGDDESLFLSGRLDSVAAMEVLMLLEQEYGIDLSDADFDIARLDTLASIETLAAATRTP